MTVHEDRLAFDTAMKHADEQIKAAQQFIGSDVEWAKKTRHTVSAYQDHLVMFGEEQPIATFTNADEPKSPAQELKAATRPVYEAMYGDEGVVAVQVNPLSHPPLNLKQYWPVHGGSWDGRVVAGKGTTFSLEDTGEKYALFTDSTGQKNWTLVSLPPVQRAEPPKLEDWGSTFTYNEPPKSHRAWTITGSFVMLFAALMAWVFLATTPWLMALAGVLAIVLTMTVVIVKAVGNRRTLHRRLIADATLQHDAWLNGDDRTAFFGRFPVLDSWAEDGPKPVDTHADVGPSFPWPGKPEQITEAAWAQMTPEVRGVVAATMATGSSFVNWAD